MIERLTSYFQIWVALAMTLGFAVGPVWAVPQWVVATLVAGIIFSGFVTRPMAVEASFSWSKLLASWFAQKVLFPLVAFAVCQLIDPGLAAPVMLVAMLPSAGVSPSLCRLLGGDISVALRILMMESLLACAAIPMLLQLMLGAEQSLNPGYVASYLAGALLVPIVISEVLRAVFGPGRMAGCARLGSFFSVIFIVLIVLLMSASAQPALVQQPQRFIGMLLFALVFALVLALVGVLTRPRGGGRALVITYGIKNMYVNIGLGLGLAASQLGPEGSAFVLAFMIPINLLPRLAAKGIVRLFARGP